MDYCEGGDLFSRVQEKGAFSEPEVALICHKLAQVLDNAHSIGIMHRDIKPENIFLASKHSETDVLIGDFGSATKILPGKQLYLIACFLFFFFHCRD